MAGESKELTNMIMESLQALVIAGRNALQTTCGLPVTCEHIQQVRQGTLTFPALGELSIKGANVQHVHIGCDALLTSQLAELVGANGADSGISILTQQFLSALLDELEGRHPTGEVVSLDVGPRSVHTRGLRTFGFRFETALGQLFLLAEIPSRMELELASGSSFVPTLLQQYLPGEWENIESFSRVSEIDNFLVLLRKGEADVHFQIPRQDGSSMVHTGFLVEQTHDQDLRLLKMTVDLSKDEARDLRMGQEIAVKVGVHDRSLEFLMIFKGFSEAHVKGQANLNCMLFLVPDEVRVEQRRLAFRISVVNRIHVEIECDDPHAQDAMSFRQEREPRVLRGKLLDLSFSGARIICKVRETCVCLSQKSKVKCRLFFPGESSPMEIKGIVRRTASSLVDNGEWNEEIGLEFLVTPGVDSSTLDHIRQYVLAEQRTWLSQRIHVAGVEQW